MKKRSVFLGFAALFFAFNGFNSARADILGDNWVDALNSIMQGMTVNVRTDNYGNMVGSISQNGTNPSWSQNVSSSCVAQGTVSTVSGVNYVAGFCYTGQDINNTKINEWISKCNAGQKEYCSGGSAVKGVQYSRTAHTCTSGSGKDEEPYTCYSYDITVPVKQDWSADGDGSSPYAVLEVNKGSTLTFAGAGASNLAPVTAKNMIFDIFIHDTESANNYISFDGSNGKTGEDAENTNGFIFNNSSDATFKISDSSEVKALDYLEFRNFYRAFDLQNANKVWVTGFGELRFTGNLVNDNGGGAAIRTDGNSSLTNIFEVSSNVVFTNNKAPGAGGAVQNGKFIIINKNAEFTGNESAAYSGANIVGGNNGGGVYNEGTFLVGYASSTVSEKGYSLSSIADLTLNGNLAYQNGGGFYNMGSVTVDGTSFSETGGAVEVSGSLIASGNTAGKNNKGDGGAIYNLSGGYNSDVNYSSLKFVVAQQGSFSSNVANGGNGGAIYNGGGMSFGGDVSFTNNIATQGGALYNTRIPVEFSGQTYYKYGYMMFQGGVLFSSNTSDGSAGAIYNEGVLSIAGSITAVSSFTGNTAGGNGGAIYNTNGGSLSVLNSVSFTSNKAASGLGGGIYNDNATVSLVNASFGSSSGAGNNALNGGGIYNTNGGNIVLTTSGSGITTFYGNSAGSASGCSSDSYCLGGAIYNGVNATLTSGSLTATSNQAYLSGGFAYNLGTLTFSGETSFSGNSAGFSTGSNTANGKGGVFFNQGTVTLGSGAGTNVTHTFSSNGDLSTVMSGGAVYNEGTFVFNNAVSFSSNRAATSGGAIYNGKKSNGDAASISMNTVTFSSNQSNGNGGAVYNSAAFSVSGNTTFSGNTAQQGGALFNTAEGTISLGSSSTEALFSGNSVSNNGGAIYNEGTLTIAGRGTFLSNSSNGEDGSGGAIYNNVTTAGIEGLTISNMEFTSNTARYGGAIYNEAGKLVISDGNPQYSTRFSSNGLSSFTSGETLGGAIYNSNNGEVVIGQYVEFSGNQAGKGMAVYNLGTLSIKNNVTFTAHQNGSSVLYNEGTGKISFITDGIVTFSSNYSNANGGGIYNAGNISAAEGVSSTLNFSNNGTYTASGGAIYNYTQGVMNLASVVLDSNSAGQSGATSVDTNGGAVYNMWDFSAQKMTVSSNVAYGYGGGVYNTRNFTISTDGSSFTSNVADLSGGAFYNDAGGTATASSFMKTTFSSNQAKNGNGGAIYNNDGKIIFDSIADISSATLSEAQKKSASETIFVGNYAASSDATVLTAGNGGAIYNLDTVEFSKYATFSENQATLNGGAIANVGGSLTIAELGTFENNSAGADSSKGGAIYNTYSKEGLVVTHGTVVMGRTTFKNNISQGAGGAIYTDSGTMTLGNSLFQTNQAKNGNGGAIYISNATVNLGPGAIFYNNSATMLDQTMTALGGAIYISGQKTDDNGNLVTNDEGAPEKGTTAVLNMSTDASGSTISFQGNKASGVANAIYMGAYSEVNFTLNDGGVLLLYDPIVSASNLNKDGEELDNNKKISFLNTSGDIGSITIGADMSGYTEDVEIAAGKFTINESGVFFNGDISLSGSQAVFELQNNKIDSLAVKSLNLNGNELQLNLNINFMTGHIDHFTLPETVTVGSGGTLRLTGIKTLGEYYMYDPTKVYYLVQDAEGNLADSSIKISLPDYLVIEAPIYNYKPVLTEDETGITFERLPGLNTPILRYQSALLGSYANTQNLYDQISYLEDRPGTFYKGSLWAKPFMTDEDMTLTGRVTEDSDLVKSVPELKVENKMTGVVAGFDVLTWVWGENLDLVTSGFIGYASSKQDFKESKTVLSDYKSTELMAGLRGTFYFSRVFLSGGALYGKTSVSMNYEHDVTEEDLNGNIVTTRRKEKKDDFDIQKYTLFAKAGVSIDFWEYATLQPSIAILRTYMTPKDFNSAASGGEVDFDSFAITELSPEVRFTINGDAWRPFVTYKKSINMDREDIVMQVSGNPIPVTLEFDDYQEYGIGLKTGPNNPLSLEASFVHRTGGREGWTAYLKGIIEF